MRSNSEGRTDVSIEEQEHSWLEMIAVKAKSRDNCDYTILCVFNSSERDAIRKWCLCGNVCTVNKNKRYFNL